MTATLDLGSARPRRAAALLELIGRFAAKEGVEAFLVGGPVRDLLLKLENIDVDIAVVGDGASFSRRLAREVKAAIRVHETFGTASLELAGGVRVDVATARREAYERPGALPRVTPASIDEDLFRRDFTVNAMAADLSPARFGVLRDPFCGARDVRAGVLRILHRASFRDDPTRILRMARFAARFGFRPDPGTSAGLREALSAGVFSSISADRLRQEIILALREPDPGRVFRRMGEWGVLRGALPGVRCGAGFGRAAAQARRLLPLVERGPGLRPEAVLLLLLVKDAPPVALKSSLTRLNLAGRTRELVAQAPRIKALLPGVRRARAQSGLHRLLRNVPLELQLAALSVLEGGGPRRRLLRYLERGRWVRPVLTGNDLRSMGYKPGPGMKAMLDSLLAGKLDGRLKDRRAETEFVARRFPLSRRRRRRC